MKSLLIFFRRCRFCTHPAARTVEIRRLHPNEKRETPVLGRVSRQSCDAEFRHFGSCRSYEKKPPKFCQIWDYDGMFYSVFAVMAPQLLLEVSRVRMVSHWVLILQELFGRVQIAS